VLKKFQGSNIDEETKSTHHGDYDNSMEAKAKALNVRYFIFIFLMWATLIDIVIYCLQN